VRPTPFNSLVLIRVSSVFHPWPERIELTGVDKDLRD
jgi:hypothetical protein